jgi:hypothetical protein
MSSTFQAAMQQFDKDTVLIAAASTAVDVGFRLARNWPFTCRLWRRAKKSLDDLS